MCNFDETASLPQAVFRAEEQAAQNLPGITFVDMSDQICQAATCRATRDGLIVYRDDNHLTGNFAEHLAPVLESRLPRF